MREIVDRQRVDEFMRALGQRLRGETRVYFTGGVTAVLNGWRETTVNLDLEIVPDSEALSVIADLKESLKVNVELAAPTQFIPELPGWQDRSVFIAHEGSVSFFHYDLHAQALAKIERSFERDLDDVRAMIAQGLIDPAQTLELFRAVEPELNRYPAIDPPSFRNAVVAMCTGH